MQEREEHQESMEEIEECQAGKYEASEERPCERQVEVQVVGHNLPTEVRILFENFPVWWLALEPSKVSIIHILGHQSREMLKNQLESKGFPVRLLDQLLKQFGVKRIQFSMAPEATPYSGLMLVSGSLRYIDLS
jgi:hypothetical protein